MLRGRGENWEQWMAEEEEDLRESFPIINHICSCVKNQPFHLAAQIYLSTTHLHSTIIVLSSLGIEKEEEAPIR